MVSNYDHLRKDQLRKNLRNISFQVVSISQQLVQSGTVLEKRKFRKPGNYSEISQNLKKADHLEQPNQQEETNQVPDRDATIPKFASKTMPAPQTESMDESTQIEKAERAEEYDIDEKQPVFEYSEESKVTTWGDNIDEPVVTSSLEHNEIAEEVAKQDIVIETNEDETKEPEVTEIDQMEEIVEETGQVAEVVERDELKEEIVQEPEVNGWGDDIPDEFNQTPNEEPQDFNNGIQAEHIVEEDGHDPEGSGWGDDLPDDFNQIPNEKPEDFTTSLTTEHISKEEPEYFNKSLTAEHNLKEEPEEIIEEDKIEQPTELKEEVYRLEQEEITEAGGWADDIIEPNLTEPIIPNQEISNTEEASKVIEQTQIIPESEPAEDKNTHTITVEEFPINQDIHTLPDHPINIQPKEVTSIPDQPDIQQFTPYFKSPQPSELFTWGHESTPSVPIPSQPESFESYEDLSKATLSLPETSQRDSITSDLTAHLSTSACSKIPKISSQDELMDSQDSQDFTGSQSFPDIYSIEASHSLPIPEPIKKPLNIPRKKPILRKPARPAAGFSLRSRTAGEEDDLENILGTTAPSMTELEANLKKYRQ